MSTTSAQPLHPINSIFLDQDLLVNPGYGNNKFVFQFPKQVRTTETSRMSVANFSVPYSWFNVTAALGNNKYDYLWYDGVKNGEAFTVTMPDGFYDIRIMNAYLQFTMIKNGHYLVDSLGNYVYYAEWTNNPTIYRNQLNLYQLPAGLPSGWSNPAGIIEFAGPNMPPHPTPRIRLYTSHSNLWRTDLFVYFGFLYPAGTSAPPPIGISKYFPSVPTDPPSGTSLSIVGDFAPNELLVHAVSLTCNYIDNPLRSNSQHEIGTTVVTTQNIDVPFGTNIANSNFFTTWIPLLGNQNITSLTFELKDQEGDQIILQDPNSNIELLMTDLRYS